jgi:hypothetical protein
MSVIRTGCDDVGKRTLGLVTRMGAVSISAADFITSSGNILYYTICYVFISYLVTYKT